MSCIHGCMFLSAREKGSLRLNISNVFLLGENSFTVCVKSTENMRKIVDDTCPTATQHHCLRWLKMQQDSIAFPSTGLWAVFPVLADPL